MTLFDWLEPVARLAGDLNPSWQSVRRRILNDPYYRLQSLQEVRLAAQLGCTLDVNQANVDDWLRLPGISIHQARTLVTLRQAGVAFYSLDDIAAALQVPVQQLRFLEPLLDFRYYDNLEANPFGGSVPINAATAEELMQVPGISSALARAIVNQRQHAPYRHLADLQQRLGLSGQLTTDLLHYLRF
ncbi:MAG: ComEA family DNA-binding protein [Synechococcales cyanobacterium M58_A2018_015]|nr:ComEA family DNA-binding protein [Synechococcales cyanobacterium M58_A2018_015]